MKLSLSVVYWVFLKTEKKNKKKLAEKNAEIVYKKAICLSKFKQIKKINLKNMQIAHNFEYFFSC